MKALIIAICILAVAGFCFADIHHDVEAEQPEPEKGCPVSKITDNNKCMDCHRMIVDDDGKAGFGLREYSPVDNYTAKPFCLDLVWDGDSITPYIEWRDIKDSTPQTFKQAMEYIEWHPEFGKTVVIEVHSFGGSLLDAWRAVGIMDYYKGRGYTIETRCHGMAMSAGFLLFANGTKGHRFVNPRAEFMWHELWSFAFLKVETPSKKEHEAEVMRHLQDNIHEWMAERSNKTKEELDAVVEFKEYWINGLDMVEAGFADGVFSGQFKSKMPHVPAE